MDSLHDFKSGYNFGSGLAGGIANLVSRQMTVVSHWNTLVENYNTSAVDFYVAVERAMQERRIPDLTLSRVSWQESGILSARREYLRVARKNQIIDICASPFGTGYFFSNWLCLERKRLTLFNILGMLSGLFLLAIFFPLFILLLIGLIVAKSVTAGEVRISARLEEYLSGLTIFYPIYDVYFRKLTYYELDTSSMFHTAVHQAMMAVIDGLLQQRGTRAMPELEPKPVMEELAGRS